MPTAIRLWLGFGTVAAGLAALVASADPLPPSATYRPLPTLPTSPMSCVMIVESTCLKMRA